MNILNGRELPAGKRFFCEETTLDIPWKGFIVRLWINNDYHASPQNLILAHVNAVLADPACPRHDRLALAEYLAASIMELTTVQVIESMGEIRLGSMLYTEPL